MEENKDTKSEGQFLSAVEIREIFDKIFKKCITLSAKSVVRMINGIFDTDYSDDCKLTYYIFIMRLRFLMIMLLNLSLMMEKKAMNIKFL